MALDGCVRVFFFRGVTSFIRLKAMSLCKSVQGGGRERGGKVGGGGGVYLWQQGLEGFQGCSRCQFPRKGVPVNKGVWEVAVFPAVGSGTLDLICLLVVWATSCAGGDSGWEEFAVDGYQVVVVRVDVGQKLCMEQR